MDNLNLKKSALFGAFWKFAERIGAQVVSMVIFVILARLLTPDDYSVVGIITVFFSFCNVFISGGFNAALIRKKDADAADYSSVFHISVLISMVMYIGLFFAAPTIAELYEKPILIPAFRVMGITLIINAVKSVVCAYTSNKLQFRKFFFATLGGTLISAVVGVWMALRGFGPWALIAQNMTNSLIDTLILFATTKLRILLVVSWKRLKELFSYGWKIFVASIITILYDESNALIISLKFATVDLAFYTKGRSWPAMLNTAINGTLSAVLLPVMSKVQDDANAVLSYTRRFFRVASFLIFPMMVGFMAVSDNFIRLLLTEKWLPAAPYLKIFCVSYMFNLIQQGNLQTIRAVGRSDIILKLEIIKKSLYLLVIIGALILFSTPEALAATVLINTLIATIANSAPNKKLIGYGIKQQLQDILPNLGVSLVMGGAVYALGYLSLPVWLTLMVQIVGGVVAYVVINVIIKNPDLEYMWKTLKGCFGKKADKPQKGKRMSKLKNGLRQVVYGIIAICTHRKSIVFESVPDFSDNTRPVFDEILRRGLDQKYNLVWSITGDKKLPIGNPHIRYISPNPVKFKEKLRKAYYLASAKCLICCNRFLKPTMRNQFAMFLSHGTPIKYARDNYNVPESIHYCLSTSEAVAGISAYQIRCSEEKMVSLGYPRNDAFSNEIQDVKAILNTKCKKVIVWYPTFRQHKSGKRTAASNALPVIHDSGQANRLNAYAAENDVLIVLKPHFAQDLSYVKDLGLSNIRIIYDDFFEENQIGAYEFLAGCDAMITDYSSVYYDYTLADKPIGAVWEDIDEYRQNPGFAIDIDYYMQGAEKIYELEQFEAFIKNVAVGNDPLQKQRRMIRDLVNYSTDGKNTQRVVDFIIQKANL